MWAKYEDTGGITGKDETGLSLPAGDMYSWGKLIAETMTDDGSVSDTGTNRTLSLCVSGQTEATTISVIKNLNR